MTDGAAGVRFALTLPRSGERCELLVEPGGLARLPELLAAHAPAPRYAVVSDSNVAALYGVGVVAALRGAGHEAELLTVSAGERHKTLEAWARLVEALGAAGLGRDGCVVAVGGGVTGDMAGFAAASYARGVRFVQVPTTLLAMIDAAIGGKTGVDLEAGKNLAGAFHQPRLVAIDPRTLATLPPEELRTGLAEAVKHGVIADRAYLADLVASARDVLALEPAAVQRLITGSVRIKTSLVARDARESGERAVLNFGHTIGHAIERVTGYRVSHGRAVAMGMVAEARLGERAGVTGTGTADAVAAALQAFGLPVSVPDGVSGASLVEAARTDKKARAGEIRYTLLRRIGESARSETGVWTHAVPDELAVAVLEGQVV